MSISDPHSYTDFTQGKIAHINFQIKADFGSRSLKILASYHLEEPVSGSLFFDSRDLQIERVFSNDRDIPWEIDRRDPILGDRLHLHDLNNLSDFSIRLSTSPAASALQWLNPMQTAGGEHPFLYSQCQSIHARSIFPCQDTPSVRIRYQAEIASPGLLKAVMAAEHVDSWKEGDFRVDAFRMPQPVPTYLFALAIGKLEFRELGPRTGVYAEPEILNAAAWEFAGNEQILTEAERLFGPYLWGRYDVLVMPPAFPYGGMENPRLTFLSPGLILGDRSRTNVISHELAHAWTGNLVTNATWEDFWLNEGWTTYAESRITEALEGVDFDQLLTYNGLMNMFEDMERFGMVSRKTCLKYSQQGINPDEVFSTIPYYKGQLFLLALEQSVGRENFDIFIQKYISTYPFESLTTEQFMSFLKQELPEAIKHVDVNQWLFAPGFPKNAPALRSALYDDVEKVLDAYKRGDLPARQQVAGWIGEQVLLFLKSIKGGIPTEDCRNLEELFGLKKMNDARVLTAFYVISIRSGYQEVLPGIEKIIANEGRYLLITRLFRTMLEVEWARGLTRPLYDKYRNRHHPITQAGIEQILLEAGQ